jgi:exonuclease III
MAKVRVLSLNSENMGDLVPSSGSPYAATGSHPEHYWRSRMLAAIIENVDPDIVGVVEATSSTERTKAFVNTFLGGNYRVVQAEKRGILGLAFLVRSSLGVQTTVRSKQTSLKHFKLEKFDADGDGIKEYYSWYNRVPFEVRFTGGPFSAPTTFILIHSKSKGVFIPGDLYAYDKLSRANRMKLKAQAAAVRSRLDSLIKPTGEGRVVVMGDFNDGPEFDIYAATLGGAFLEPVMGSVWDPARVMHNTHAGFSQKDRWTIDYSDRILNPLGQSRYGQPTEMRSWIDHILVSPALKDAVDTNSADIVHKQPNVPGLPNPYRGQRGTDHHPPYVDLDL